MTVTAMPPNAAETGATEKPTKEGKKSKKKLIIIVVAVLVLAGGGYKFLAPHPKGPPVPGSVVTLDPIQINLDGNHYLRIGLALQMVAGAAAADGSKALDATIDIFSGLPMSVVNNSAKREGLKTMLVKRLETDYNQDVMGVYFTELVTQ
jgi:flagellar FliL protein